MVRGVARRPRWSSRTRRHLRPARRMGRFPGPAARPRRRLNGECVVPDPWTMRMCGCDGSSGATVHADSRVGGRRQDSGVASGLSVVSVSPRSPRSKRAAPGSAHDPARCAGGGSGRRAGRQPGRGATGRRHAAGWSGPDHRARRQRQDHDADRAPRRAARARSGAGAHCGGHLQPGCGAGAGGAHRIAAGADHPRRRPHRGADPARAGPPGDARPRPWREAGERPAARAARGPAPGRRDSGPGRSTTSGPRGAGHADLRLEG